MIQVLSSRAKRDHVSRDSEEGCGLYPGHRDLHGKHVHSQESEERNVGHGDRKLKLEVVHPRFTADPRSVLMEVRKHPMPKQSLLITSVTKPHNA